MPRAGGASRRAIAAVGRSQENRRSLGDNGKHCMTGACLSRSSSVRKFPLTDPSIALPIRTWYSEALALIAPAS